MVSYATNVQVQELNKQTDATLSKNVKFDAYFEDGKGQTHYVVADVNNEKVEINLNLAVQKEGYFKNFIVLLKAEDE